MPGYPFQIGPVEPDHIMPSVGPDTGFIFERYDMCPKCRAQEIEIVSFNNIGEKYREAVNFHLAGHPIDFNRYEIYAMKCKRCHTSFIIDWTNTFPRPLLDMNQYNWFLNEFIQGR